MKVTRQSISTEQERASLARLDYEALRRQTARFWSDQVSPWAELKTPEPELNAFHKAHLAHQMISDHRMSGEGGLTSTSVGADAYGNYGNESTMVIQELEERGLHEDVRKRLVLWLKYQGTAKLAGRFSEHWKECSSARAAPRRANRTSRATAGSCGRSPNITS